MSGQGREPAHRGREARGERPSVVVVVGPTATGKTALALELADRFGGEVVGADAYQVYRHMDVGTAKPTAAELDGRPYHLVDVADPDEPFDAHRFVEVADAAIDHIRSRGKAPIVAGGTGLYVRSLVRGLAEMPGRDEAFRAELLDEAEKRGAAELHRRLAAVDPDYAARIGEQDLVRIVRALEVHRGAGKTMTEVHAEHARAPDRYRALWLGLDPGQEALRAAIEERTDAMMKLGFLDEVRRLSAMGYGPGLAAMKALGYRHMFEVLNGTIGEEEAARRTTRDTARFARRQRRWFRSEPGLRWLGDEPARAASHVEAFLSSEQRLEA